MNQTEKTNKIIDELILVDRAISCMKNNITCWEMGDDKTYYRLLDERKQLEAQLKEVES